MAVRQAAPRISRIEHPYPDERLAQGRTPRDSVQALAKLGELAGGRYRIVSQPPVIVPARDLAATFGLSPDEVMPVLHEDCAEFVKAIKSGRLEAVDGV